MTILKKSLRSLLAVLMMISCAALPTEVFAFACTITGVRVGGQAGDNYIGPTCNPDTTETYRTCFYVTGQDLPANSAGYRIFVNGLEYPVAFSVALSTQEVVLCASKIPSSATPNTASVTIQLAQGCSFFAPNLYTQPVCVCTITGVRVGGQPGDNYIGPTCNPDTTETYRTCFYVSGQGLPTNRAEYRIFVNGVEYPVAFSVALSAQEVVLCASKIPSSATPNTASVTIQLKQGCSFFAPNLYTEPACVCTITGVRVGGQAGDNYIGPVCNLDETYRVCFYVSGQFLPASAAGYRIFIDGKEYPVAFSVALSTQEVVLCASNIPSDRTPDAVSVTIQLKQECSYFAPDLYIEPVCVCTITGVRVGGQAGDSYIGPVCGTDGTYRTCFYVSGYSLSSNAAGYELMIDGEEYPIAFSQVLSPQQVVVCATNIPANGTQDIPVYVKLADDCDYFVCNLYDEPASCPGGSFPPDPFPGPWAHYDVGNANGNADYDPCDPVDFTVYSSGFSTTTNDVQHIAFQEICGDAEIIAHISSIQNPGWAGIEMRENLTPGSKKTNLKTQLGNYVRRERRTVQNGAEQSNQLFRPNVSWLKIVRSGNNFQGFTSSNGQTWQFAYSVDIPMAACLKVGMFVESINVNTVTMAAFDNISISGAGPVPIRGIPGLEELPATYVLPEKLPVFSLYPNPAEEEVNIELVPFIGQKVEIAFYTIEGRLVKTQTIDEVRVPTERISLQDLPNGTYLVKIIAQGESLTKKLIVFGN